MTTKNIILVGFMGAGKTVTARVLAERLGRTLVSTDDEIIAKEGRSINDIFRDSGEAYFRQVEQKVVRECSARSGLVIDCGGGIVLDQANMDALKTGGTVIYLKTSPDVVYARVKDQTHRPLLNVEDPLQKIRDMLQQRAPFYAQADHAVDTDGKSAEDVAEEIIKIIESQSHRVTESQN